MLFKLELTAKKKKINSSNTLSAKTDACTTSHGSTEYRLDLNLGEDFWEQI